MEKIKLNIPVIVEGKYDKITLGNVVDANIITTDGFGVFNNKEKRALIRRLSENGVIVMCDSDGAGKLIRSHLAGILPADKIYQLYVPQIEGKERRKAKASAEGFLGVEGMSSEVLRGVIESFLRIHPEIQGGAADSREAITKTDLYFAGLSGGDGSAARRDELARRLGLPAGMTANALLAAMNMIITRDEFLKTVCEI